MSRIKAVASYRLHLELLEQRLVPGDTLLGLLCGLGLFAPGQLNDRASDRFTVQNIRMRDGAGARQTAALAEANAELKFAVGRPNSNGADSNVKNASDTAREENGVTNSSAVPLPAANSMTILPGLAVGGETTPKPRPTRLANPAGASKSVSGRNYLEQAAGHAPEALAPPSLDARRLDGSSVNDSAMAAARRVPSAVAGNPTHRGDLTRSQWSGFVAPQAYPAGQKPVDVVSADFNGDGLNDVAVANEINSGTVTVLLGASGGGFQAPRNFPSGGIKPTSLAAADADANGTLDIIVTNRDSATIAVLRGSGTGRFRTPMTSFAGTKPTSLDVGDFNGDGKLDAIVVNLNATVSVLLGKGAGAFEPPVTYDIGTLAKAVVAGDFNGDGKLDFSAAGFHVTAPKVVIFLGLGDGSFQYKTEYQTGAPGDVSTADFNGDGNRDLAVANNFSPDDSTVSVRLGNGDGTFAAPIAYAVGKGTKSVLASDVDGDGDADLLVANTSAGTVDVFLSNGNGSFQPKTSYAAGVISAAVIANDLDGDGVWDLAVSNAAPGTGTMAVLKGLGGGAFEGFPAYPAGSSASGLAVTNLNGDGDPDLVIANKVSGNYDADTLSVLLGVPGSGFAPKTSYAAGGKASAVVDGDFNGDGVPDISVCVAGPGSLSVALGKGDGTLLNAPQYDLGIGSAVIADFTGDGVADLAGTSGCCVNVFQGNGDGSFQPGTSYNAGGSPRSLAAGDFNGDGWPDLVVGNDLYPPPSTISILLNLGGGTFGPPVSYTAGDRPWSIAVSDLNADAVLDLAVASLYTGAHVFLGNGDGSFQAGANYPAGSEPSSVVVGDFNADGKKDLVFSNYDTNGTVNVLLGNGDGSFQIGGAFVGGSRPTSVSSGDLNGDGKLDLAVTDQLEAINVLLGNGDGSFQPLIKYPSDPDPLRVIVEDFDGDGILDLASANSSLGIGQDTSVTLYRGRGDGSFEPPLHYHAGSGPGGLALGDLNGDSRPDLVVVNISGGNKTSVLLNEGSHFDAIVTYDAGSTSAVAVGDFNADGNQDLAVTDTVVSGKVNLLLGTGNGDFLPPVSFAVGSNPAGLAAGDFNADGKLDLAAANSSDGTVSVLIGNGNGTFQPALTFSAGITPTAIVTTDLDADGVLDLAVTNYVGVGSTSVLIGRGDGTFMPPASYAVGASPSAIVAGDFDHDGNIDLAVANSTGGTVSVLLGVGNGTFHAARFYVSGAGSSHLTAADFDGDGFIDLGVTAGDAIAILVNGG